MGILTSDLLSRKSLDDSRLLADVQTQPASLAEVLSYYRQEGAKVATQAADLLQVAERVVITGMGASLYAAVGFESELSRQGIHVSLLESAELLHYHGSLKQGTFVMVISRSGETVEIQKLAEKVRKQQCPLIAVTNNPQSPLASISDLVLPVPSHPDGDMAIQSYTATVLTLEMIASRIRGDIHQTCRVLEPLIVGLPGFIARMIKDAPRWDSFFDPSLSIYFLGRGPSFGSAQEAAMLWNETAKQPAFAMTAGNFRHGHIEVVDPKFRGVIFAPEGRTQALNLGLGEAIEGFGGKTMVIGAERNETGSVFSIETLPIPETIAPLIEIIPIQIAAARLAAIKGLPVGALRHAQSITRDEIAF